MYFGVDIEYWDRTDIKMFAYMLLDSMSLEAPTIGIKSSVEQDQNSEEEVHIKLMEFDTIWHTRHILNIEDEPIALTISLFGNNTRYFGIKATVFNRNKLREDGIFLKVETEEWRLSEKEITELPKAKRKDKLRYYYSLPQTLEEIGFEYVFRNLKFNHEKIPFIENPYGEATKVDAFSRWIFESA